MSVINNMLRNLDERRGANVVHEEAMMDEVAVAPRKEAMRFRVLLVPLVLGVLAVGSFYLWPRETATRVPKLAMARVVEVPAPPLGNAQVLINQSEPSTSEQFVPKLPSAALSSAPALVKKPESLPAQSKAVAVLKNVGETSGAPARSQKPTPPRPVLVPAQQSLPMATPVVTLAQTPIVQAAVSNASIRLEPSTQSAQERNLTEVQRAADLQRRGALVEAESALRSVLDNDKGLVAARLALVSLLSRQQRSDDARKVLKDGVDIAPTQSQLLLPYARQLAARGEWNAAHEVLTPAVDALAQDAEYRALLGAVLQRLGYFSQSANEYRAAVRQVPSAGAWWMGLGLSLEGEGRRVDARSAYLQAKASNLSADLAQFVDNKLARLGPTD